MDLQKQAYRGFRWTAFSAIVRLLVQLLQLVLLGRFLSPEEFGLLAIVQVVTGFSQIFLDMGISNSIIHKQEISKVQLSSLYWLNIFSGLILFLLLAVLSPFLAYFYHQPLLRSLIILSSISLLILPLGQQYQVLLQKKLNFNFLALAEITASLSSLGTLAFFLNLGFGIYSFIYAAIISSIVITSFLIIAGIRFHRPELIFRFGEVKNFVRFGIFQIGERSLNYFSSSLDRLVIGKIYGTAELGFYSIAQQLLYYPIRILNPIISRVALPVYARLQDDIPMLNETYMKNISLVTLFTFPVYTGLFAVSSDLLPSLLGPGWERSNEIFRIIWILGIFKSMGNPLGSYLYAQGRADLGFYLNIFQLMVYLAAFYAGSFLSLEQMLIVFVIANILFLAPADYLLRYYLTRMPVLPFIKAFLPNLLAAIVMFFMVWLAGKFMKDVSVQLRLITSILIGMISYGSFALLMYGRKLKQN